MKTIAEPKELISNIWGEQRIRNGDTYRLMHYVFRVNHEGNVLLHNVVTGQLVLLDQEEEQVVNHLPATYTPVMEQLVHDHFLVPEGYDEHQQVVNLRTILRKLGFANDSHPQDITEYTILPTTACNARCYYCFEQGVRSVTMTEHIADETVRFISEHCGKEKKISIRWFGGEPTVATHRIDQICNGLQANGIRYSSSMTTNGYLFDEEMVSRARTLWHLKDVMISVDGTERNYNEIKSYVNAESNPYQRVLRNVGLLIDHGIAVSLRMNFDVGNYFDFKDLLKEASERFQGNKLLRVYAFPLKGCYSDKNGRVLHGSEAWFDDKLVELNDMARKAGLFSGNKGLPSLFFSNCNAGSPSFMVVTPEGKLGRCTGIFFEEDQIVGDISDGLTGADYCSAWAQYADPEKCIDCTFFPRCVLIEKCPGRDRCFLKETSRQYEETVKSAYDNWRESKYQMEGGKSNG